MKLNNICDTLTFKVYTTLSDIEFIVELEKASDYDTAMEIAQEALDDWFDKEDVDYPLPQSVAIALEENNIKAKIFYQD